MSQETMFLVILLIALCITIPFIWFEFCKMAARIPYTDENELEK